MNEQGAISTWEELRDFRDRLDREGKRLVFTNGCFDILHLGHVRYLRQARGEGDALVVALNGDESVRQLKGPGRPVNPAGDRAEVLSALEMVDRVIVFEETRATRVIEAIRPHVYVKGGDYTPESLNAEERAALGRCGTAIRILQLVEGKSTSATLEAMGRGERIGSSKDRPLRLGVLGSGRGTTFENLLLAIDRGELRAEIVVALSDVSGSPFLVRAGERGIPAVAVDPGPFRTKLGPAAQKEMRDRLLAAEVDLVILAGFMRRLKEPLLDTFENRILNIHPSLLPEFPGREAWRAALDAGARLTGATVHLVDAGVDTGRVLAQEPVTVQPDDTPESLQSRIQAVERQLYPRVIRAYGSRLIADKILA